MTAEKELRKRLKNLEASVHYFLAQMDVVMLTADSHARGKVIANLCNELDMQNQIAARFGLGVQRVGGKLRKVKP